VCTVVAKLFNLVQCDEAVFGKKDYQQLAIIRRMVRDLDFNIVIHGIDTVREADGLAMSSRNRYLSADERAQAPVLRAALLKAREAYIKGGERDGKVLRQMILDQIAAEAPLGSVDYVEIVDASTLQTPTEATELVAIAVAVFFGSARLIDNIELK
jgi:pantoate--beta-alanine ligase